MKHHNCEYWELEVKVEGTNFDVGDKFYYVAATAMDRLEKRIKQLEKVAEAARKNIGLMCINGKHEDCRACAVARALEEMDGEK